MIFDHCHGQCNCLTSSRLLLLKQAEYVLIRSTLSLESCCGCPPVLRSQTLESTAGALRFLERKPSSLYAHFGHRQHDGQRFHAHQCAKYGKVSVISCLSFMRVESSGTLPVILPITLPVHPFLPCAPSPQALQASERHNSLPLVFLPSGPRTSIKMMLTFDHHCYVTHLVRK